MANFNSLGQQHATLLYVGYIFHSHFFMYSNQYNKLGLNQRQTFIGQMRRILNKTQLQVRQALVATPIKELGKHRVVDMSIGPTHSCLVTDTGKVCVCIQ